MARHPEASPFDQEQPDARGEVRAGDHVLRAGETVHFTDNSRPNHAPDTTATRAQHEHGRLRRAFDRVAPPGSKRRTAIVGGTIVGGTAGMTVGGGAEQAGHAIGESIWNRSNAAAESAPFGVPGVSVKRAARGVTENQAAYERSVAAAEAGAPNAPSLDTLSAGDQAEPSASEATEPPVSNPKPPTGGLASEHLDTGGLPG